MVFKWIGTWLWAWWPVLAALALLCALLRSETEGFDIEVRPSKLGGRGVFATRDFKTGETVERAVTMSAPADQWGDALKNYLFESNDGENILVLGNGSMYQHDSTSPNVQYQLADNGKDFEFVTTRAVKMGDELRISYGTEQWFKDRGIKMRQAK